jgi:hypothetical protein
MCCTPTCNGDALDRRAHEFEFPRCLRSLYQGLQKHLGDGLRLDRRSRLIGGTYEAPPPLCLLWFERMSWNKVLEMVYYFLVSSNSNYVVFTSFWGETDFVPVETFVTSLLNFLTPWLFP